jgi:hypothetical protein
MGRMDSVPGGPVVNRSRYPHPKKHANESASISRTRSRQEALSPIHSILHHHSFSRGESVRIHYRIKNDSKGLWGRVL